MLRLCEERKHEYMLEIALGISFWQAGRLLYVGIASNNEGFEELTRYLSYHNNTSQPLLSVAPRFDNAFVVYPWGASQPAALLDNEFIGVRPEEVSKIAFSPYAGFLHKLVIFQPVTFPYHDPQAGANISFNVHRLLRAIDQNTVLSKLSAECQASPHEAMVPEKILKAHYKQYPQLIKNTQGLLAQCRFNLSFGISKNKRFYTTSKREDYEKLKSLALAGFEGRFAGKPHRSEALSRLYQELEVIAKKNFEAYYLITLDIVQYARHENRAYEHVGRGSGANSLVAYCIGLTDVDPIVLDLYFERFLNPERSSPPDFDIDFSWKDRDDITQYIFEKYGRPHTALLGTHTTYKDRSIIRELGKVFGLPKAEIDEVVAQPARYHDKDNITKLIFRYARRMRDIPANLSIHAGGILITEQPIYAYTATDFPPKGYPTTHFDMHSAEDIGIYKFDILSQRGLGHIKDTLAIIKKNQGIKENTKRFDEFQEDKKIKKLLSTGKTMGCFYVESPAMRMLLGKLSCNDYITLVAASSIIRPGVARSGMMRAYIERHHATARGERYESIHPKMDELMQETYGVMVYQEDVIKVAHHFGGLTLAEADILRRGMSGKFRSRKEFQRVEQRFFENCRAKGFPEPVIARVWYEIESFSGYSFSKGHSASYAVESYESLYLKAHYPLEFMVGVINNFGGFYKTEFYFHEARMSGAEVAAPCVNHSEYYTNILGRTIYIGFVHLKSLATKLAVKIVAERQANGPYSCLDNFIRRVSIGLEQLRILIRIGAFRITGKSKKALLWEGHLYFGANKNVQYETGLFDAPLSGYTLPQLENFPLEDAYDEMELLGFPLCEPFKMLASEDLGDTVACELMAKLHQNIHIVGYLVTRKNTTAKGGKPMHFGTFYDYKGQVFDTTHFPNEAKRYPFRGKGFYRIRGKVVEDFGYPMIEVAYMEKLPMADKYHKKMP